MIIWLKTSKLSIYLKQKSDFLSSSRLSETTQIIWVSHFRYLSPLGDNFELFGQIFKYFIEETTKNQPGTNLGQLKNRFLRQIETPGWPIFDQVGRPSRLVLGKKFFWIWFIYALEGIVLASQFFFDKVSHLKHPSVHAFSSIEAKGMVCFGSDWYTDNKTTRVFIDWLCFSLLSVATKRILHESSCAMKSGPHADGGQKNCNLYNMESFFVLWFQVLL